MDGEGKMVINRVMDKGYILSVLLRFTASDYPFGIFKRFLQKYV